MTTKERIANINHLGNQILDAKQREEDLFQLDVRGTKAALNALAPRLHDLMDVALALWRNKIPLGKVTGHNWLEYDVEFMSEGIHHRIGFIGKPGPGGDLNREPIGFGIVGGGVCGRTLFIDTDGNLDASSRDYYLHDFPNYRELQKAKDFISGFDDFERRFYEYVDSLS